jgi:hypothetical protein
MIIKQTLMLEQAINRQNILVNKRNSNYSIFDDQKASTLKDYNQSTPEKGPN